MTTSTSVMRGADGLRSCTLSPRPSRPSSRLHRVHRQRAHGVAGSRDDVYISPEGLPMLDQFVARTGGGGAGAAAAAPARTNRGKPATAPPDLPSMILNSRVVFIGMPLVSAVTELVIAQILWLQFMDNKEPIHMYLNSTGTTRADGETVAFESEGMAIYDAMKLCSCPIYTVNMAHSYGQACMLLAAGQKGKRFSIEHGQMMLQQPSVPPTGSRQAIELQIKWRETYYQYQNALNALQKATGHSLDKLDYDLQRPLYMSPIDAIEYGVIDQIIEPKKEGGKLKPEYMPKATSSELR